MENLKNNLGCDAQVSEEQIKGVCRSILEEAKQMYLPSQSRIWSPGPECSDSENNRPISNVSGFSDLIIYFCK